MVLSLKLYAIGGVLDFRDKKSETVSKKVYTVTQQKLHELSASGSERSNRT